jgi:hypothetical protein
MAVITTGNHPKALWPGIKAWWGRSYDEHTPEYPDLFDNDTSSKSYEEDVQVTGFGLAPVKAEGASTQYDSETQGYVSRYNHVAYSLGYICTREELADGQYEVVSKRRVQALAFSMRQTKENVGANVYNRAFNSSFTGGDGVELLSLAHPTIAGNQANELSTAAELSEVAIEDMAILVAGALNDKGLKISLMPRCLVVPRQLQFEAHRIVKSTLQNDTANNAVNAVRAMNVFPDGIKMNHYLTSASAWFMRTTAPRGLIHYEREAIEFTKDNDFDTDNAKAKAYERYSFDWTDWRGLYGTAGV